MSTLARMRRRTHLILEVDRFGDRASRIVDKALILLIIANVVVSVIQTVESTYAAAPWAFEWFERLSILLFGLEYVLRVWSSAEDRSLGGPILGRVKFALQPMMLLDLAVLILPVYFDLRPLRILRLLRLGRYSPRLRLFARVLTEKRDELFVGLFVAVVMLVASSTAMYHVEHGVNPAFASIPETMWWGVATLTTVGYGDVYPITPLGQMLGAVVALLGIGVFALPAGILASGFSEALERERSGIGTGPEPAAGVVSGYPSAANGGESPPDGPGGAGDGKGGTCPTCGASR